MNFCTAILFVLISLFPGCDAESYTNSRQEDYVETLRNYNKRYSQSPNEIGKKEVYAEYCEWLTAYFYENDLILDWEGEVRDITVTGNAGTGYNITAQIRVDNQDLTGRTTFLANYLCDGPDDVYNSLKSLRIYDRVVFSGEIIKNYYKKEILYENISIDRPEIYMNIKSIRRR